jgi:apolipoprotein N-acyltransferase
VFLIRDGRFAGRYDKMALLPFAESNPLQALLPRDVHYSPGESLRLLETSVLRVGAFLCSEALDPSLPRRLVRSGAQLLANPANDDWFGGPAPARIHLYTAAARAIENRRYLVRTTPTGYSAIIDPHGRVTAVGDLGGAEVVVGHVRASHAVTLYQQIGEAPAWLALAIVVAGTARARWPRKRINGGTS